MRLVLGVGPAPGPLRAVWRLPAHPWRAVNPAEAAPWVLIGLLAVFLLLVLALVHLTRAPDDKREDPPT